MKGITFSAHNISFVQAKDILLKRGGYAWIIHGECPYFWLQVFNKKMYYFLINIEENKVSCILQKSDYHLDDHIWEVYSHPERKLQVITHDKYEEFEKFINIIKYTNMILTSMYYPKAIMLLKEMTKNAIIDTSQKIDASYPCMLNLKSKFIFTLIKSFDDFYGVEVLRNKNSGEVEFKKIEGFGFTDCSQWIVFDTIKEAEEFIKNIKNDSYSPIEELVEKLMGLNKEESISEPIGLNIPQEAEELKEPKKFNGDGYYDILVKGERIGELRFKLDLVKFLSQRKNIGLKDAKDIIDNLPFYFDTNVKGNEAMYLKMLINKCGYEVELIEIELVKEVDPEPIEICTPQEPMKELKSYNKLPPNQIKCNDLKSAFSLLEQEYTVILDIDECYEKRIIASALRKCNNCVQSYDELNEKEFCFQKGNELYIKFDRESINKQVEPMLLKAVFDYVKGEVRLTYIYCQDNKYREYIIDKIKQ